MFRRQIDEVDCKFQGVCEKGGKRAKERFSMKAGQDAKFRVGRDQCDRRSAVASP